MIVREAEIEDLERAMQVLGCRSAAYGAAKEMPRSG